MTFDFTVASMLQEPAVWGEIGFGILETLYMTFAATLIAYIIGIPLGVFLTVGAKDGIAPKPLPHRVADITVNLLRAAPFMIMVLVLDPVTKFIAGTRIGSTAAIVPLFISAAPFVARLVESSLKEVDKGVIEAAQSMGASKWNIIFKVLLPEARNSLIIGAAIAAATVMAYTAMAGALGAGGLGKLAMTYGYSRYQYDVMLVTLILMVAIVQGIQYAGMRIAKKVNKRV